MYILFCCPLPFENENIIMIQTNALLSWKNLNFFDKIIITGNENGVKEFCLKHNFDKKVGKIVLINFVSYLFP